MWPTTRRRRALESNWLIIQSNIKGRLINSAEFACCLNRVQKIFCGISVATEDLRISIGIRIRSATKLCFRYLLINQLSDQTLATEHKINPISNPQKKNQKIVLKLSIYWIERTTKWNPVNFLAVSQRIRSSGNFVSNSSRSSPSG